VSDFDIGAHFWSAEHTSDHARHTPAKGTNLAVQATAATADLNTYTSFPSPLTATVSFDSGPWLCLLILAAYVETAVNNVEVVLSLDFSGATTLAAGTNPEDRLHLNAKSPAGSTLALSDYGFLNPGDTVVELKYAATGAANVSDIALAVIPMRHQIGAP
jgi:hypothetical protein